MAPLTLYGPLPLAMIGFTIYRTHLLSALLCLESMMLSLFIMLTTWSQFTNSTLQIMTPIMLLTFSACETGLGLSLMIATARTHGNDHLNTLNLLQW
uniref:NADH-ubiquinone oxidoreductase chain 4L n=1 Tax=Sooglossus thomasseti TaxID=8425 RepID=K9JZ15_SOOTH|nr:NADH dehydrogenase subunit 4L [Sooglossus thomasseti]AEC33196.1 NADH dehydrogenase subunit 4L [Sooglossus thomasseti]AGN71558.1 NADH dehydrogenase subunit 4L [Sooglossus thomasseti]